MERSPPVTWVEESTDGPARTGVLHTPNGRVDTPFFMPVATRAAFKGLTAEVVGDLGFGCIVGNAFHLSLRPGDGVVAGLGGAKNMMGWDGAILSDSGGFQVFSLAAGVKLSDDGVWFRSPRDGSRHFYSPERVMQIQRNLRTDIAMVLDVCPDWKSNAKAQRQAVALTLDWARRSAHEPRSYRQAVWGIVQGGFDLEMRTRCLEALRELPLDNIAIGGVSVGEPKAMRDELLAGLLPRMPADKPRYIMGVGALEDLVDSVAMGADMFDCVLPTRNARNGHILTHEGVLRIRNSRYKRSDLPLSPSCVCPVCQKYSRAYLHHLFREGESLGGTLASIHNLHVVQDLMNKLRSAINKKSINAFVAAWKDRYHQGVDA